jgi:hypothetical protein
MTNTTLQLKWEYSSANLPNGEIMARFGLLKAAVRWYLPERGFNGYIAAVDGNITMSYPDRFTSINAAQLKAEDMLFRHLRELSVGIDALDVDEAVETNKLDN